MNVYQKEDYNMPVALRSVIHLKAPVLKLNWTMNKDGSPVHQTIVTCVHVTCWALAMGGGTHCCIVGCHVNSKKCKGVSFHKLPIANADNNEWRRKLIQKINRADASLNPDNAKICSRQFLESCFKTGKFVLFS